MKTYFSLTSLRVATILYLALPIIIFLFGWLRFPYSLTGVILLAFIFVLGRKTFLSSPKYSCFFPFQVWPALLIFSIWSLLSGIGGLGLNTGDILCGDSVIFDLTFEKWPLRLTVTPDMPSSAYLPANELFHLVYYIGFYLPSGLAGKLTGSFTIACIFETIYSFLGTFLAFSWFLYLSLGESKIEDKKYSWLYPIMAWLIFAFFKTNSFIFVRLFTNFYDLFYWGHGTTLLYGAPQHTISAWLTAALLTACWKEKCTYIECSLALACCCLITPFALIGCFVFWVCLTIVKFPSIIINYQQIIMSHIIIFFAVFLPCALYITSNSLSFPMYTVFFNPTFSLWRYCYGLLLSIGVPGILLLSSRDLFSKQDKIWMIVTFITLFLSTTFNMGYCNDFPIRSSCVALFVLYIFLMRLVSSSNSKSYFIYVILFFCLVSVLTYANFCLVNLKSLGIPPSDNIESFIRFPEKGTVLQRRGNSDSVFYRYLASPR